MTFSVCEGIFYPPNFGCFEQSGLLSTATPDYNSQLPSSLSIRQSGTIGEEQSRRFAT
jgi:hypothetical protein